MTGTLLLALLLILAGLVSGVWGLWVLAFLLMSWGAALAYMDRDGRPRR